MLNRAVSFSANDDTETVFARRLPDHQRSRAGHADVGSGRVSARCNRVAVVDKRPTDDVVRTDQIQRTALLNDEVRAPTLARLLEGARGGSRLDLQRRAAADRHVRASPARAGGEDLRAFRDLPRVTGYSLVVRSSGDVKVLKRPRWWTIRRLGTAVGVLLAALLAILVWNASLQRLAVRKGRELLHSQLKYLKAELKSEERTRLAIELHDSLSQTLTGVSMEIAAAEDLLYEDPRNMAPHLARAERTLKSCRDELRNCLWDLRNDALDEPDMTLAVRKTLQPHIDGQQVAVRFNISRARISDNTAHALLRMIRELVMNALRHGQATSVKVAGSLDPHVLRFSVRDNGVGFDPENRPGILQGHFGLQGIQERLEKMGGTLTIRSAPGHGTSVTGAIPRPTPAAGNA